MNRKRRGRLKEAERLLGQARNIVEDVLEEERDSLDNCPENLQSGERYSIMENAVSELEDAISSIDEASEHLDRAEDGD